MIEITKKMHIPAYLDAPPSTHLNACVRYATMRMLTTFEHQNNNHNQNQVAY